MCQPYTSDHDPNWEQGPSTPKQSRITSFAVTTSKQGQQKFDLLVGEFFFANNLTFRSVESKEFKEMCNALHPGYKPPNRKRLAGDILESVHSDL